MRLEIHNLAHHSSKYMRFSISLMATPSPAAVLKCAEPVKRKFNWTKDFKHCTKDVNMSRVSRPEKPRSNRKTRNSEGRLWISTSSSWSKKFWHPVSESCTIFLPTSAFTASARSSSSVPPPWWTNPYQLAKAKGEWRASSTRWKLGSPSGVRLQMLKVASFKTRKSNAVQNPNFVNIFGDTSILELSSVHFYRGSLSGSRENLESANVYMITVLMSVHTLFHAKKKWNRTMEHGPCPFHQWSSWKKLGLYK